MLDLIDRLRKKPRPVRERIALLTTLACVALVVAAWVPFMQHRIASLNSNSSSSGSGSFQELSALMSAFVRQGHDLQDSVTASSTDALSSIPIASSTLQASSTGLTASSTVE